MTGFVIFDLDELAYDIVYHTERGTAIERVSDNELVLNNTHFRLPVFPFKSEVLLECEVVASTAKVLLELHAQRKIGGRNANANGVLLFDDKKMPRIIMQVEDLRPGIRYSSNLDELAVERLEHNGKVQIKIRQSAG